MKWRNFLLTFVLCLSVIPLLVSCGTGVDSNNNNSGNTGPDNSGNTESALTFTPSNGAPGQGSIVMKQNAVMSNSDIVAIDIDAHQASPVFGAAFDIEFDPGIVQFDEEVFGSFFMCDNSSVCKVKLIPGNPSKLVIAASLKGSNTTQGDGTILTLKFKAVSKGNSALSFKGNSLLDSDLKAVQTNWYGGVLKKS